jgi:tRNA pseudouridine55 synthase
MGMIPPEIFAVWKPKGPSSNGVLNGIRRVLGTKHVGHAGTLDPLAEGILVVGIGKGTKGLSLEVAKEKEYLADIRLGAVSSTDDGEGMIEERNVVRIPSDSDVSEAVTYFKGIMEQVPPVWSAIKVGGKESYKLARQGKDIPLKPRKAEIKDVEVIDYSWPALRVRFVTGPGVYIRSLARDIGDRLGTGGYLAGLIRTRVGSFERKDCLDIESLSRPSTEGI